MLQRLLRHLFFPPWWVHVRFPRRVLAAIERAIAASEKRHRGQIVFAVEGALPVREILRGLTPRQRALQVFAELRVWDTEENIGVLLYVLLAEHAVEIVADRAAARAIAWESWVAVAHRMEEAFRRGDFEGGVAAGIASVTELLATHFPGQAPAGNELADRPRLL